MFCGFHMQPHSNTEYFQCRGSICPGVLPCNTCEKGQPLTMSRFYSPGRKFTLKWLWASFQLSAYFFQPLSSFIEFIWAKLIRTEKKKGIWLTLTDKNHGTPGPHRSQHRRSAACSPPCAVAAEQHVVSAEVPCSSTFRKARCALEGQRQACFIFLRTNNRQAKEKAKEAGANAQLFYIL